MALSEKDWREFKVLKATALERYSASILADSAALCTDTERSSHERYLSLYKLVNQRNRAMAKAFDGHSRSKALYQLRMMHMMELITDEELESFGLNAEL